LNGRTIVQVKTNVKAGGMSNNHNESLVRTAGLKVKTNVKAGGIIANHNETLARVARR
jgi:hypothetical protein